MSHISNIATIPPFTHHTHLPDRFGSLLGASPQMRELHAEIERIASTDVTVLVQGETGSGKDVVAESLHLASSRRDGPYVVFDCGAVAPLLAESELFGHERGAFTGAMGSKPGVFELAHHGTLLLDELGELPKDVQPKLLRALEKREIRRVGGVRTIQFDVRIIAATNRDLFAEVRRRAFREDLYYRVAVAQLAVPALRDHIDDLPLLVRHFMAEENPTGSIDAFAPEIWEQLFAYGWPGNVRELRNVVQRLIVAPDRAPTLPPYATNPSASIPIDDPRPIAPLRQARRAANARFEREYLRNILNRSKGNITRAASIAEVSRQMMARLVARHAKDLENRSSSSALGLYLEEDQVPRGESALKR
jgi:transcriptional regulator with GAF, ATPase, and Fis domain